MWPKWVLRKGYSEILLDPMPLDEFVQSRQFRQHILRQTDKCDKEPEKTGSFGSKVTLINIDKNAENLKNDITDFYPNLYVTCNKNSPWGSYGGWLVLPKRQSRIKETTLDKS